MLNARTIQGIVILIVGVFLSIWLGMAIVTDQTETLLKIAFITLLITATLLGPKIWLLMILFSSANVILIRGFGTTEIGQALFLGFSMIMFLMRKLSFQIQFKELEVWTLVIIATIFQAYVRNPVGLNLFGASNIGGKPYIILGLSMTSALVLSTLRINPRELKWAVNLSLLGGVIGIPVQMLRYGNLTTSEEGFSRIPSLSVLAQLLSRWLTSRISPIRVFMQPMWGFIMLVSLAMASGSGYRSSVAIVGSIYLLGIIYHSGFSAMLASLLMGAFGLALLALINLNFPLPPNIQRALSPLPGTWEERYVKAGENSTDWRMEMWVEALTSERWIRNKIWGDGIGMTTEQLAQNEAMSATNAGKSSSGLLVQQENMLINGSYHSGPVHSIRMTGYVGLMVLLITMIRVAVHAHRQIVRCRGTEWFHVALFFGIPLITMPFTFTFIFGEYHTGVAQALLGIAIIRLMERNLPLPAWKKTVYQPYILQKHRVPA